MKNLLHPKWLIIANTLPVTILLFLLWGDYRIINSLLSEQTRILWKAFGISLATLTLVNLAYAIYLISAGKQVTRSYSLLSLVIYVGYLYLYFYFLKIIMPVDIPQWMVSGNVVIYHLTFLMPVLAYSLLVLVATFTTNPDKEKAWLNFLIAVLIPFVFYYFLMGVFRRMDYDTGQLGLHLPIVICIITTLLFLFFLARGIYILVSKRGRKWKNYQLLWKIPFTLIFPLLGLCANNGVFLERWRFSEAGIFGDFFSPWFYVLVVLTGILLCLPNIKNKTYRVILFVGRCITFAYTLYFFIVFLPYLPLSLLAILIVGLGFLMLTPVILFIVHINELSQDFRYLSSFISKNNTRAIAIGGFLFIPLCISVSFVHDRLALNNALDYVYEPDYSKSYTIDKRRLAKTLINIQKDKSTLDFFLFTNTTPYISSYYNWLVLDNLTLSEEKMDNLRNIFYGAGYRNHETDERESTNVSITQADVETSFDESTRTYKSWVHLEITNLNDRGLQEFATTFELPVGCYISDYYLYVGDEKEPGILSEKKTAMWVFSQIQDEDKDPGILHYSSGNRIVFKVFPFDKNEVRKTGIEFIHKEPVSLTLAGHNITLGEAENNQVPSFKEEAGVMTYLSAAYKEELNEVQRKPYFHFLIDNSEANNSYFMEYSNTINALMQQYPELSVNARFSIVSDVVHTFPAGNTSWTDDIPDQKGSSGYFLDRGIKLALYEAYQADTYPVLVAVTDNFYTAAMEKNYRDYQFMFPESDDFYVLSNDGELSRHSLAKKPKKAINDSITAIDLYSVLEYKTSNGEIHYLRNDNAPGVLMSKEKFKINNQDIKEKDWNFALLLQGHWMWQLLHPEISGKEWVKLADYSFKSQIMTPVTSYIVVENEAQKEILKRKQGEVLISNKSYDIGGAGNMSEPDLLILLIILGVLLWLRKKKGVRA